ncbi:hypothetical protein PBCVCVM1_672L [Paramecium bursaria Chlorella virus CVM-1]|jgi:hypothetical protein|uniref:Uncharacterized protein M563L n=1 Tax=Paramecium bursaria Chlorella virus MT325 TaxID=346932 RepID=A7IUU3_PBCVM|nr:hypothetical protein MT325_M563L [Paramecium bursaria chlorella virus MT325]AGE49912.1 hypothetical protein PBCVCan184_689L [Paramecium bursaria Chlorella virus Can18-4]AGE51922.1 hypothetical protein PBCVCVM1_672L [Paramecium bursaria Chlorella virus CVM-1]
MRDTSNLTPQQISMLNNALFEEWDSKTQDMKKKSESANIAPGSVKPSDVSVSFGPVMTEAQFKEYQKRKNTRMTVMKAEDLQKMFGKK